SVNQNDVTSAKSKLNIGTNALKQSLANQLSDDGYFAITDTYSEGTPNITQSAQVGQQANTLTITETITYTMFGAHKSDLEKVIKSAVQGQIDTQRQALLDYGLSSATFTINSQNSTSAQLSMSAKTTIGPQLDVDAIKQEVKGQHSGEIKDELTNNPDVKDVQVKFSPFWISTVPKNSDRITVNIAKPEGTSSSNGH
ncbi:MAG TPA: hypothetical protein VG604_05130, partial [Candidatus Saccharimonadales bacterium]|nr:hypothetical protein [Candidatus Saccharimonadales bacterium]